jgi:hypothetical protein
VSEALEGCVEKMQKKKKGKIKGRGQKGLDQKSA